MTLEERVEQLEFYMSLLLENSDVDRFVFESKISHSEYVAVMDLMDEYRSKIENGESISSGEFETAVYENIPSKYGDYHFCETITRLFAKEGRWEEVFPALYGNMPKYKGIT